MQRFEHQYEVLIQARYLKSADPQEVYKWLEANRATSRSRFADLPEQIRRALISRNDPLISLGLAEFSGDSSALKEIYASSDTPVRCAVLSNPAFGTVFYSLTGRGGLASRFFESDEIIWTRSRMKSESAIDSCETCLKRKIPPYISAT